MGLKDLLCCSAAVIALAASPGRAQQAPAPAPATAPDVAVAAAVAPEAGDIIVTASRAGRSGYDAPTPTKVLGEAAIAARGSTNIGDFLNEIPAFRPSQSAQTNPQQNSGAGQTYADLRGLGNIRTLTLVDGRRFVPSSPTGQVDLNLIPTILVERVEVVTGGASAQWGSDAVAGVVNVILDKKLQGFKSDLSLGVADKGDNFERRAGLAVGTAFASDRGHIVVGGEYVQSDGIGSYLDRAWGRRSDELVSYTGARPADQPPRFYASGSARSTSPRAASSSATTPTPTRRTASTRCAASSSARVARSSRSTTGRPSGPTRSTTARARRTARCRCRSATACRSCCRSSAIPRSAMSTIR